MLFSRSATLTTLLFAALFVGLVAGPAAAAETGTIQGRVTNLPKGLEDHVVVFLQGDGLPRSAPKTRTKINQKNRQFDPQVVVVVAGSIVEFPNHDKIMHNVFSPTEGSTFDLGYYKQGESKGVPLDKPGVVSVYCNIHPNMVATVFVAPNDAFKVPSADGRFELKDVPPGTYELSIWSSFSGAPQTTKITVEPGATVKQDLRVPDAIKGEPHVRKDGLPYGRYK